MKCKLKPLLAITGVALMIPIFHLAQAANDDKPRVGHGGAINACRDPKTDDRPVADQIQPMTDRLALVDANVETSSNASHLASSTSNQVQEIRESTALTQDPIRRRL